MYLIVGANDYRHLVLATLPSATDALNFCRAKAEAYDSTYVVSPEGVQLDEAGMLTHSTAELEAIAKIAEVQTRH